MVKRDETEVILPFESKCGGEPVKIRWPYIRYIQTEAIAGMNDKTTDETEVVLPFERKCGGQPVKNRRPCLYQLYLDRGYSTNEWLTYK